MDTGSGTTASWLDVDSQGCRYDSTPSTQEIWVYERPFTRSPHNYPSLLRTLTDQTPKADIQSSQPPSAPVVLPRKTWVPRGRLSAWTGRNYRKGAVC